MTKETVGLDYETMYKELNDRFKLEIEEQNQKFKDELDKERNTKNVIIESQLKDIEFYKNIIKGILHIK